MGEAQSGSRMSQVFSFMHAPTCMHIHVHTHTYVHAHTHVHAHRHVHAYHSALDQKLSPVRCQLGFLFSHQEAPVGVRKVREGRRACTLLAQETALSLLALLRVRSTPTVAALLPQHPCGPPTLSSCRNTRGKSACCWDPD